MRRAEQEKIISIGQDSRRRLETTFGIVFENPPVIAPLTPRVVYERKLDDFERQDLSPVQRAIGKVLETVDYRMYWSTGGLFREENNTCYIKPQRGKKKNVLGKKEIPTQSVEEHAATHELTHAYLFSRNLGWRTNFFWNEVKAAREGRMPNIEGLLVASIWEEGVSEFTAITAQIETHPEGLYPRTSDAAGRNYTYRNIQDTLPEEISYYNTTWLFELQKALEGEYVRLQEQFNLTYASRMSVSQLSDIIAPRIPPEIVYASGFNFADGAFEAMWERGYSLKDAFEFLVTHAPQSIYDITHPNDFVSSLVRTAL